MTTTDTRTLSSYFETRTRDDGTRYVTLTDDRPEWLHDAVMEAHDDEGPNDWRYETCRAIAEWIDELDPDTDDDADTFGIADSLVDVYTSDRMAWLAGNINRPNYCDEAAKEYGAPGDDIVSMIGAGQFHCIRQMAEVLLSAARDAAVRDAFADMADDDTDEEG